MINFTSHKLKNGLRVILAPMHETQAVTVLFLYGVGSRFETDQQNGLSHFLEHMFFKGTTKRPTTLDISQELDTLGAQYNAFTGEEQTGYYVAAAAEHFPIAFDVLTDMLYESKFEAEEIEREKGVISEEIKMYHNDPQGYLSEISKQLIFGDTPLGRDIAGTISSISAFNRDHVVNHRQDFYGPENTIIAIAGNPKDYDWLTAVEKALGSIPSKTPATYAPQKPIPGTAVKVGHRDIDQVHLSLMHYGISYSDPRLPIIDVMNNILGGTMSSRLFVEVRERRGLAYYCYASRDNFHDIGTLEASAGVDPAKLNEAVSTIVEQINRLKNEPVSEAELMRAKQNIKGRMSLRLEDSHSIARFLAYDELELGRIRQPEEIFQQVEKVTQSDIMEIAREFFDPAKRKLAVVGPIDEKQSKELEEIITKG